MRRFAAFVAATIAFLAAVPAGAAQIGAQHSKGVVVRQTNAVDGSVTVDAFQTLPASVGSVQSIDFAGQRVPLAAGRVGSLPKFTFDPNSGNAAIQASVTAQLAVSMPSYAATIAGYLRNRNIDFAWVDVSQAYQTSAGKLRTVAVNALVKKNGAVNYPAPKIIDAAPTILYVKYVPLTVAEGLPPTYAYPDAGTLSYQIMDRSFKPIGAVTKLNVGAAYDAPPSGVGDLELGLRCLADRTSSAACPTGVPDVRSLIASTDTNFAVVDYVRTLEPVYNQVANGDLVAVHGLVYTLRELNKTNCTATTASYRNAGGIGFLLSEKISRFLEMPDGFFYPIAEFERRSASPTEAFDYTLTVGGNETVSSISNRIIAPDTRMMALTTDYTITSLAPVTLVGSVITDLVPFTLLSSYPGSCGRATGFKATCNAEGVVEIHYVYSSNCFGPIDAFPITNTINTGAGAQSGQLIFAVREDKVYDQAVGTWSYDGLNTIRLTGVEVPGFGTCPSGTRWPLLGTCVACSGGEPFIWGGYEKFGYWDAGGDGGSYWGTQPYHCQTDVIYPPPVTTITW